MLFRNAGLIPVLWTAGPWAGDGLRCMGGGAGPLADEALRLCFAGPAGGVAPAPSERVAEPPLIRQGLREPAGTALHCAEFTTPAGGRYAAPPTRITSCSNASGVR